jgi:hypothetical protein
MVDSCLCARLYFLLNNDILQLFSQAAAQVVDKQ